MLVKMAELYFPLIRVDEQKYARHLQGNAKIWYEEIKNWQKHDKRKHRIAMLLKPFLIAVFVMAYDSDFREVADYILARVFARRSEFYFPPHHLDPDTWTNDQTNTRNINGVYLPPEVVMGETKDVIYLNIRLPPKLYWCAVKPAKTHHYAINSNTPIRYEGGQFAYAILRDYGSKAEFDKRIVMGD